MAFRVLTPFSSGGALLGLDPLLGLHKEMNRLFDGALRDAGAPPVRGGFTPRMDVVETQRAVVLSLDLPGIKQEAIELQVDGDVLTVSGERVTVNGETTPRWHIVERASGRFERSVQLPFAPDPSRVQARFEDGVLSIEVPKDAVRERGRKIEIGRVGESRQVESQGQAQAQLREGQAPRLGDAQAESDRAISKASASRVETPAG
ncbi:MAG: type effector protein [Rhizobacter sp.]|nr:type effector protein [Rhizobacter sp.]